MMLIPHRNYSDLQFTSFTFTSIRNLKAKLHKCRPDMQHAHRANKCMKPTSEKLDYVLRRRGGISTSFQRKPQNKQAIILISYDRIRH